MTESDSNDIMSDSSRTDIFLDCDPHKSSKNTKEYDENLKISTKIGSTRVDDFGTKYDKELNKN